MIAWLNQNSGFMLSLLTLVYAVTSLIMAWFMRKSNKLSSDAILQGYELEKQRSRPYLIFDFEIKKSCVHVNLKNIGLNPAYEIKIDVEPKIIVERNTGSQESGITKDKIQFMAPNREIEDFICSSPDFLSKFDPPTFIGTITYRDSQGIQYTDPFTIDLSYRKSLLFLKEIDASEELEKIRKETEKISSSIRNISEQIHASNNSINRKEDRSMLNCKP